MIACAIVAGPGPARSQSPGEGSPASPLASVLASFDSTYPEKDGPVALRVIIDGGASGVDGSVVATLGARTTSTRVEVSPGGRKIYQLYLENETNQTTPFRTAGPLRVQLKRDGQVIAEHLAPPGYGAGRRILQPASMPVIRGAEAGPEGTPPGWTGPMSVASAPIKEFPASYGDYYGTDGVVLSEGDWLSLDQPQKDAIEAYLVLGGSLVVIARDALGLQDSRLQELTGLHEPSAGRLAAPPVALSRAILGSYSGPDLEIEAPPAGLFYLQGGISSDSGQVVTQGRDVLVQMRRHGQGVAALVRFDAASAAFRDWSGDPAFWRWIFDEAARRRSVAVPARDLVSAQQAVEAVPRMPRPPAMLLIGLGLLYVTLFGPLNLWVLRRLRRTVRAWLVTPALAIVMTLILLSAGSVWGSTQENLNRLTILDTSSNIRFAVDETLVGVLTPAARGLTIRSDDPAILLRQLADSLGTGDEASLWPETQGDDGAVWLNPTADQLSLQLFASRGVVDLGGRVRLELRKRGETVEGRVVNETGMALRKAYLYDGKNYYRMGSVAAGAAAALPAPEPVVQDPASPEAPGLTFESRLSEFYEDGPQLRARGRCDAVLVAETDADGRGLETPQFSRGASATVLLVRWRLPVNQDASR